MFVEERTSTSKKRQERNRAGRRRHIQARQQQKQEQRPTHTISATATAAVVASASRDVTVQVSAMEAQAAALKTPASSNPRQSAVGAARAQREVRQWQRRRTDAAVSIQAWTRACGSNTRLRVAQGGLMDSRMSDLATLGKLLRRHEEEGGGIGSGIGCRGSGRPGQYVPPPATVSAFTAQLLFLTHRTPWRRTVATGQIEHGGSCRASLGLLFRQEDEEGERNMARLSSYLRLVLLPGLDGAVDASLDPALPWLDTDWGRRRLDRVLAVAMEALSGCGYGCATSVAEAQGAAADLFRLLLGGYDRTKTARAEVLSHCRKRLLWVPPSPTMRATMITPFSEQPTNLDLIRRTRMLLLFDGGQPIPEAAERDREGCVSKYARKRADTALALLLDVVLAGFGSADEINANDIASLGSRFVTEILTVPLLTWKVSKESLSVLVARRNATPGSTTLIESLRAFASRHMAPLSLGEVRSILPTEDVPPTSCPAPPVMCLLANVVQLGRMCPAVNASDPVNFDQDAAAIFYNVVATLIDAAPVGALSSRPSAVEWVRDGTHSTPVVLPPVLIEQCREIFAGSYVRNLFAYAINDEAIGTDHILRWKDERDSKYEDEMREIGNLSSAALAAEEAMLDRTKSLWQSSKWAKRLSKGISRSVTTLLSGDAKEVGRVGSWGGLVNTSSMSRKLAKGSGRGSSKVKIDRTDDKSETSVKESTGTYSTNLLFVLCRLYGTVLAKWGGSGGRDLMKRSFSDHTSPTDSAVTNNGTATDIADPFALALLNVLCFSTGVIRTIWAIIQSDRDIVTNLASLIDSEKGAISIRCQKARPAYESGSGLIQHVQLQDGNIGSVLLFLFVACLGHALIVTDDVEIHDMDKPLPVHQLRRCILLLKKLLYRASCIDGVISSDGGKSSYLGLALTATSRSCLRDLYDRSSRRPICPPKLWLVEDLLEKDLRRCSNKEDYLALLDLPVLRICPFLVSFKRRLKLFERIVTNDRVSIQGSNDTHNLTPGIVVPIMRGRVLEDGLIHLNKLGSNLRRRLIVQYTSVAGATETGVDVGGLFKEFWTDLSNLAFDPNFALFKATEGSGNCLYPNPSSRTAHGSDHVVYFEFLGRILGKALYEGVTIQPQFAHFFLSFLRGDYNFLHMLPDLSMMDQQLYNNLMFLKTYKGDASDLCLSFMMTKNDFGGNEETPLVPNGANIEVTNANKHRYIGLVAKEIIYERQREQAQAFVRGLWEVIDRRWLLLFNEPELQVLISGSSNGAIDLKDLKSYTRYAGGFTGMDRHVSRFWNVFASLPPQEQAELLRFVTSCERPPPLGFQAMNPPFTVQRVAISRDADKLPSASTCFNTLKLPTYSSEKVMKQRLLYAIKSESGFELT